MAASRLAGWSRIEQVDESVLLERLNRVEQTFARGLETVSGRLELAEPVLRLFVDGLEAYRKRLLQENQHGRIRQNLLAKASTDPELGFAHRKILEVLLNEYDFSKEQFRELYFSRLVRLARVGKNRAKGYLRLLEQKGLVGRKTDGYRIFWKISADHTVGAAEFLR